MRAIAVRWMLAMMSAGLVGAVGTWIGLRARPGHQDVTREAAGAQSTEDAGTQATPPPTVAGATAERRPLVLHVHTPGEDASLARVNTAVLRAPHAYAGEGTLSLEFDAEPVRLLPEAAKKGAFFFPPWPKRLLVRLFDRHGQYLTHFATQECFAPDANAEWKQVYLDARNPATCTPGGCGWSNAYYKSLYVSANRIATVLAPTGNRLAYPMSQRELDYTASVEIGFLAGGCLDW